MIMAYIPCKDEAEAKKIAGTLIQESLAACAGMWPIRSLFMWKGRLADEAETVVLAKSSEDKWEQLKARVKELHSYELPAIIRIGAQANSEYEKWLRNEVTKG